MTTMYLVAISADPLVTTMTQPLAVSTLYIPSFVASMFPLPIVISVLITWPKVLDVLEVICPYLSPKRSLWHWAWLKPPNLECNLSHSSFPSSPVGQERLYQFSPQNKSTNRPIILRWGLIYPFTTVSFLWVWLGSPLTSELLFQSYLYTGISTKMKNNIIHSPHSTLLCS